MIRRRSHMFLDARAGTTASRHDLRIALPSMCLVLLMCLAWGSAFGATLPLSLYDDFSGDRINPAKWQNLERVREIRDGKFVSAYRLIAARGSGNPVFFTNPSAIQSFQADVRLNAYTTPPNGESVMWLQGSYYNDGTAGPGQTGDIWAALELRGTGSGVDIGYEVQRCSNADCSQSTDVVPSKTIQAATLGQKYTLGIGWNGAVFRFTVDGVETVVDPISPPTMIATPMVHQKGFSSELMFDPPGGEGYVAGDFDNVYVNGVLYDDFSGARLDPARWTPLEQVREVAAGRFVSKSAHAGQAGSVAANLRNRLRFMNQNGVKAMRAEVTVTEFQSTGSSVQARLTTDLYNDGASSGAGDITGEVDAYLRIISSNGGPLTVQFFADRANDPLGNTTTVLNNFFDSLGTVSAGETHSLFLQWDGSVVTYGMDGVTRTFDPKPFAPIVKEMPQHFREFRTSASVTTTGGHGYIAATFDNVYVNDEAVVLPGLSPFYQTQIAGDVASAGVGLRGTGGGTITLNSIPPRATVQKAFLYAASLGEVPDSPTQTIQFNGTPVTVTRIGQSDDPLAGVKQSFAWRADVTSQVPGNGSYTLAGLPTYSEDNHDMEGAALVVIYELPGAPQRAILINDGAVTLSGARLQYYATPFTGFTAADPPTGAILTFLVGNGEASTPEYAGLNTTLLATSGFSGSNGNYWDTKTYDISDALPAGATSAESIVSTENDSLVWVASILSVPGTVQLFTPTLRVTKLGTGSGTVTSNPTGLDCGPTCSGAFPSGDVTLTATPAGGSTFIGWSGGGCTGTGTCTVSLTQSEAVSATFASAAVTYSLQLTFAGDGIGSVRITPPGVVCTGNCTATFQAGEAVTLSISSVSSTSNFTGWSGEGCTGTGTCILNMTQNRSVTATFTRNPQMLQVNKGGDGSGTVTSSPAGIDCGATCRFASATFPFGTTVTLTATPAPGSVFLGWSGYECPGTGTCTMSLTQFRSEWATFAIPGNLGTISGVITYAGPQTGTVRVRTSGPGVYSTTLLSAPGAYSIQAPAGCCYQVQAWIDVNGDGFAGLNEATAATSSVSVTAGQTTTVNLELQVLGAISGRVVKAEDPNPATNGISGATVSVFSGPSFAGIQTGSGGTFYLPYLAPGTYKIRATAPGRVTTFHLNSTDDLGAIPIVVTAGATASGKDIIMPVSAPSGVGVSLTPTPSSGTAPLNMTLTATVSGTATGAINYTFWWHCTDAGTNVAAVTTTCGDPTNSSVGAKFEAISDASKSVAHTYANTGTYTAKVIAERGGLAAEHRRTVTVAPPFTGLPLYDDFSGDRINSAKWQNLEIVREIRDGKLVLNYRAAAPPGYPSNDLSFVNPATIQSFQADVRLNAYTAPPNGSVRLRLRGNFYNDGTIGQGATGDVRAELYLRGSSSGVDIRYRVYKCTNADCSTSSDVIATTTLMSAALGEVHTLGIAWDGSVFTFTVDTVDTVVDPRPVQPVVNAIPNSSGKILSAQLSIEGAGGEGYVAGDFDNVTVNGILYEDFSGPRLDPSRWANLEEVREIVAGHLVSKATAAGTAGNSLRNRSRFINQNAVTALRAEVTVTEFQSPNSSAQARLNGAFYNDGASTGGLDQTGDVAGYLRIFSNNGGPLTVQFFADRCNDRDCNTSTILNNFFDSLGTVNLGETHTLTLVWDGSVITYSMDGVTRAFDPKPFAPVVKPPVGHFKDIRTQASVNTTGGHGFIAATFDNVYVNSEALTPPHLAPAFTQVVNGDVVSAGVGLRGRGSGTINLTGIPAGATVQKAFLYWATLGTSGTFIAPTLNGTPVSGALIGQSDPSFTGAQQSYAYAVEVTGLVTGNGPYSVAGLPSGPPTVNDSLGASLVVLYSLPGAAVRTITANAGAVYIVGSRLQLYASTLRGFVAADPPTGATLTFIVGDGDSQTPEYAGLNTTLLATNAFSASDGNYWDTRTYDVSTALVAGATQADAIVSTATDGLVWVATILSVPSAPEPSPTYTLTVTKSGTGNGTVTSDIGGIDCGATCSAPIANGSTVTLTAAPDAGSIFGGWTGEGCSGTGTCTIPMTQVRNVTATFNQQTYTLTISRTGTGGGTITSDVGGITCGGSCSSTPLVGGTVVTLTATPDPGSVFAGWSGACTGTTLTCTVTVTQATSVTATFALTSGTGGSASSAGFSCASIKRNYPGAPNGVYWVDPLGGGSGSAFQVYCDMTTQGGGWALWGSMTNMATPSSNVILPAGDGYMDPTRFAALDAGGAEFMARGQSTGTAYFLTKSEAAAATCQDLSTPVPEMFGTGPATALVYGHKETTGCDRTGGDAAYLAITGSGLSVVSTGAVGAWHSGSLSGPTLNLNTTTAEAKAELYVRSISTPQTVQPLTVTKAGTGSGTVTSSPSGITCGTSCSAAFATGSSVALTATGWVQNPSNGRYYRLTEPSTWHEAEAQAIAWGGHLVTIRNAQENAWLTANFGNEENFWIGLTDEGSEGQWRWASNEPVTYTNWYGNRCYSEPNNAGAGEHWAILNWYNYDPSAYCDGRPQIGPGMWNDLPNGQLRGIAESATPLVGSIFLGWSGACTGTSPTCTVSMDQAKTVTATFTQQTYFLNVSKAGTGSGTVTSDVGGINCGATCGAQLAPGTTVTLTATPTNGATFTGWTWNPFCNNANPTCTVTLNQGMGVWAIFDGGTPATVTLSVSKNGTGAGTVTDAFGSINCGPICQETVVAGNSAMLTAAPASGSYFAGWSGACTGGWPDCAMTMDRSKTVTATFNTGDFSLSVAKAGTGGGGVMSSIGGIKCDPTCATTLPSGTAVTLTANPYPGSAFTGWSGACMGTSPTCTVTMDQAKTVTAMFTATFPQQIYTLNVNKGGTGSGLVTSDVGGLYCGPTCNITLTSGTNVTLTATAYAGSTFTGWSGEGCSGTGTCTLSMTQARNVTAAFSLIAPPLPGLSLYDDFSGGTIDASKWEPLEFVREIQGGKLVSKLRGAGPPGRTSNSLQFANPATINSFQADARLNSYSSPPGGAVRVRLTGSFYSDSTGAKPAGDETGDVLAQLYLLGTGSGVDLRYLVFKCTNRDCSSATTVVPETIIKAAALGEPHTLGIGWNGAQFTFTVDGVSQPPVNPADCTQYPTTCQPIVNPVPNVPFKLLGTQVSFAGAGGEGSVAGDFDNIYVNGTLYDNFDGAPFSGPRLDPVKWARSAAVGSSSPPLEIVREITAGKMISKLAGTGVTADDFKSRARFLNLKAVTAMRADVTVTEFQSASNAEVRARLVEDLYNDGSSTGASDLTGDVKASFRIRSVSGGPLEAVISVSRISDPQGNTDSTFMSDSFGAVNPGETHTLLLAWDGSVITYGMDGNLRTFDPKPFAAVVKPRVELFSDIHTHVFATQNGGYGYIAATFDNVYVNGEALSPPKLEPFYQSTLTGDVVSAGVGLRGTGTGTINLTGIPTGATVQKAFLYWATLGGSGTFAAPTLNGTPVTGALIGRSTDPFWGVSQAFGYRADVTALVTGNGAYTLAGLPAGPLPPASLAVNDSEGASLVVIYSLPGAPQRVISINDGAVTLTAGRLQYYATPFTGFVAANPPIGAKLTFLVGDGQTVTPEYAGLNTTLLATNEFSGSNGNYWDTRTYDVSSALPGGATQADAIVSTGNDGLIWVAAILSVPEALPTYTLTVAKTGTGTGTVTSSSPSGISCGPTCSASFPINTYVTLTATADPGSFFAGWSGGDPTCMGTGPCSLYLTQARTITATFTTGHTLSVTKSGAGNGTVTSTPGGITCSSGTCTAGFGSGTSVTLTASPLAGSTFDGWSGACTGTGPCTVTMTQARSVTATFSVPGGAVTLTVAKIGTGTGTVTSSSPSGISCGPTCSASFPINSSVTLTATPDPGSVFAGWGTSDEMCMGTGPCSLYLTQARTVTATFTQQTYTLNVYKGGTGSGLVTSDIGGIDCGPTCLAQLPPGTVITLTATPTNGATLSGWMWGCGGGSGPTCTVTLDRGQGIWALFEGGTPPTATLSVTRTGTGGGTVASDMSLGTSSINCGSACSASVPVGNSVLLNPAPASGSYFAAWSGGGCTGSWPDCLVTLEQDKAVTATFLPGDFTLTLTKSGLGYGTVVSSLGGIKCDPTCAATLPSGATVTLTALPHAGSTFTGWSGACTGSSPTCTVTMDQAQSVTATFTAQTYTLDVYKGGTGSGLVTSDIGGIDCGPTCLAQLPPGTVVTLTATPTNGATFSGWNWNCFGVSGPTCTVTLDRGKGVWALFDGGTPPTATLSVTRQGTGNGTVTSDLGLGTGSINCGTACSASLPVGNSVLLSAAPASGSYFAAWSGGGCMGSWPDCIVTMDQSKTVIATFNTGNFSLTVAKAGTGGGIVMSSIGGIKCDPTCAATLPSGATVTLTPFPHSGASFTGWSGACTGTSPTCTVTMDQAQSVTATLGGSGGPTYPLTVRKSGTGTGTLTSDFGGINCGATCSAAIAAGNSVTLTATPASGSFLSGWSEAGCGSSLTCVVRMDTGKTVFATFGGAAAQSYTLTVTRSGTGTVTSDFGGINCGTACSASIVAGNSVTLTATPASGSTFAVWRGGCGGTSPICTLTMDAVKSVTAIFTGTGAVPTNLLIYDDFSASHLDPTRWVAHRDSLRVIQNGALVLAHRSGANSDSNLNTQLRHVNPPVNLTALQADLTLTEAIPPAAGYSRLRIRGAFYNDGTAGTGSLGDIWASTGLRIGPSGAPEAWWGVFRCGDAGCNFTTDSVGGALGPVALNQPYTVAIAWDASANAGTGQFTFTATPVGGGSPLTQAVAPPVASAGPRRAGDVRLRAEVTSWTSAPGVLDGYTQGTFDNVYINGSLYDDFNSGTIDAAKWRDFEWGRMLQSGALVLNAQAPATRNQYTSIRVPNPNGVTDMAADVTLTDRSLTVPQDVAHAGLQGAFYNTGTGTVFGDVHGQIFYWTSGDGTVNVNFNTWRSDNAGQFVSLFGETVATGLALGETHRLRLGWDGAVFTYGVDNLVRTFDPRPLAPVVRAPVNPQREVYAQAGAATGGRASLTATVDAVWVNPEALAALPGLRPFRTIRLAGDVATASVGLRGTGLGTISLTTLPANATVQQAWLYWATLGNAGTFTNPTLNSTSVNGALIGQGDDPLAGAWQSYAYRADVTSLVPGNGSYLIAGLPADGPTVNDTEGASLVVLYTLPNAPVRQIAINDGLATLTYSTTFPIRLLVASAPFTGLAPIDPTGATLTVLVGDGQVMDPGARDFAGLNATLLTPTADAFTGSDGPAWDTKTLDASTALTADTTDAAAVLSTWGDSLVWVAAILSTPLQSPALSVSPSGTGTVTSSPAGISCPSDCSESYAYDTPVTLVATPATGSTFTGWSVDGGTCPTLSNGGLSCTVTMTQAHSVTATFVGGAGDTTPPAAVTTLTVGAVTPTTVTLTWTAPGDNGSVGTAAAYDLRYATAPLSEATWASATPVAGEPAPGPAGTAESFMVLDLSCGTSYYFAMKSADAVPNWSGLSNSPAGTTTSCTGLDQGLVASYPFSGNANDASGNGNHGTVSGATLAPDRSGTANSAYSFDGVDDYIAAASSSSLTPPTEVTLAAWVNTSDVTFGRDGWQTIVSKGATYYDLYADYTLILLTTGEGPGLKWESSTAGNTPNYISTAYPLANNTWYHVAATYAAGTVKLYINGALQTTGTVPNTALRASAQPLYIGARYLPAPGNAHTPFRGQIDDVRIYSRALSDSEIGQLAIGWFDDFESYAAGTFPSTNWTNSGNTAIVVEAGTGVAGSQSLKAYGVVGSCWGALAHRPLAVPVQSGFVAEMYVRNGSETLSGCHSSYGDVQLFTGPTWTTPGRILLSFDQDDNAGARTIRGAWTNNPTQGPNLSPFTQETWYKVRIKYERVDSTTVRLGYWIDDAFRGSYEFPAFAYENDLAYLTIGAGEGTAWFDNVRLSPAGVTYPLTVSKTGSGTVTSSPAGITCGSDCSEAYPAGTSVTLTATPDAGSTFTGWGVDGGVCPVLSGDGLSCTVSMTQARNVTATFVLQTPVNVDSKVSVTYSGLVLNRVTNTFDTWATITNTSPDSVLRAPMSLVITSIAPSSVTLANPSGQTAEGTPFIAVALPEAGLAPGESVSKILLKFTNPIRVRFIFTSSVLAVESR